MLKPCTAVVTDPNEFLHRVLIDGRYFATFDRNPQSVAQSLGIELSDEAALKLSSASRDVLLDGLYSSKFGPGVHAIHPYILQECETADIGITIAIGIGAGIVTAGIAALIVFGKKDFAAVTPRPGQNPEGLWTRGILDYSAAAASKL